jgi:phosphohistidine phosphatase
VRRLTLMRHADAQWKDPAIPDFERPLNRRGIAEAEAMARRLAGLMLVPDLVIASPARRTQQTGEVLARELALRPRNIRHDEALYLARPQDILAIVQATGPRVPHLLIIGHNPGISDLARQLALDYEMQGLATAAMCSITFDVHVWSAVGPETSTAVQCEAPPSSLFRLFA